MDFKEYVVIGKAAVLPEYAVVALSDHQASRRAHMIERCDEADEEVAGVECPEGRRLYRAVKPIHFKMGETLWVDAALVPAKSNDHTLAPAGSEWAEAALADVAARKKAGDARTQEMADQAAEAERIRAEIKAGKRDPGTKKRRPKPEPVKPPAGLMTRDTAKATRAGTAATETVGFVEGADRAGGR